MLLQFNVILYQGKMSNTFEVIYFLKIQPDQESKDKRCQQKESYYIKVTALKCRFFDCLHRIFRHLQHILYILIFS